MGYEKNLISGESKTFQGNDCIDSCSKISEKFNFFKYCTAWETFLIVLVIYLARVLSFEITFIDAPSQTLQFQICKI